MLNNLQMLKRWYILKGKIDPRSKRSAKEWYIDLMVAGTTLDPKRLP